MSAEPLFLGVDSSTQGLKATITNAQLAVVGQWAVNFDADLPEFKTDGGVHRHADGLTVTSPALMWVAALDLLMDRMQGKDAPLGQVVAISGSGQQHGSVWLRPSVAALLAGLSAQLPLRPQLDGAFTVEDSPIWMDSSTRQQCAEREAALGGAQGVAELTGSRAFERFTGNQIAKIYQMRPGDYAATGRICLVSSFMASLFCGAIAPIDASDGAGMNLMDLRLKKWSPEALRVTAPDLEARLGSIVPSHAVVGRASPYWVQRHGFAADCVVIAFTGDNPNSLAGLRLGTTGDVAISLGTSDTLFASLARPTPSAEEGHIFANPVDPDGYMALICRKNGSLTREVVRDQIAEGSWAVYNRLMAQTMPGNRGQLGIYVVEPEITPPIQRRGQFRFDEADRPVSAFPPAVEVRAVVENQFMTMRLHGAKVGIEPVRLIATGGASVDKALLQVAADVFGTPVFVAEKSDSSSLGAAYRAQHGWTCHTAGKFVPFNRILLSAPPFRKAVNPDPAAHASYTNLLPRLDRLERQLVG